MHDMQKQKGFTIWFTGLPCSGKSTLAQLLQPELERRGHTVDILDGDVVRTHLTRGLGFSREDRDENIRRIGFVCMLISRHGGIAIAAAISPYRNIRDEVRATIENFVEVYVDAPLEECIRRDVKGMYTKAMAGELPDFTGVSAPYEPPHKPEVTLHTEKESAQQSAGRILGKLEQLGLIEPAQEPAYSPEEAAQIHARLEKLGYIE